MFAVADQALRESEFLRRVLDNLFAFVALLTPDGIVMEVNLAPLKAAGIDLPDVQGRRFEDCYWWSYAAQVQAQLREAMARAILGEKVRYDVEIRVADGRLITINFMIAPLRDEAGAISATRTWLPAAPHSSAAWWQVSRMPRMIVAIYQALAFEHASKWVRDRRLAVHQGHSKIYRNFTSRSSPSRWRHISGDCRTIGCEQMAFVGRYPD